ARGARGIRAGGGRGSIGRVARGGGGRRLLVIVIGRSGSGSRRRSCGRGGRRVFSACCGGVCRACWLYQKRLTRINGRCGHEKSTRGAGPLSHVNVPHLPPNWRVHWPAGVVIGSRAFPVCPGILCTTSS